MQLTVVVQYNYMMIIWLYDDYNHYENKRVVVSLYAKFLQTTGGMYKSTRQRQTFWALD